MASHSHLQVVCSAEKESFKKLMLAVHVTSHSHLQVVCSADKESKKTYAVVHVTSHSHLQLFVVLKKSPLKNLRCSTCDITFSLASCVQC